ncbi:MAG: YqfO family protein [Aquirhabdus sp.]
MYKLTLYVPDSHVEVVKKAIFAAGAGRYASKEARASYDSCSWQVMGQGQFQPLEGAMPFIGDVGKLETVAEWRVETVVEDAYIQAVIQALRAAHPYEMPAFDAVKIEFW